MKKHRSYAHTGSVIFAVTFLLFTLTVRAQDAEPANYERDTLIKYAKEIMEATRYCALITLDKSGYPQVRTMDPFLPDDDMVVWLGTNINSRKVREIRYDSRVSLYYEAPDGGGYVVIQGNAHLIDDPEIKKKYWKDEWETFYPDRKAIFTLIKVIPKKLEIIYYKGGISSLSTTWEVPYVEF